jgi:RNA polymerase sigma-70 factor (ECF subfamily)
LEQLRSFFLPGGGQRVTVDIRHQIIELLPKLRRFACALTGDTDRGDDLVQETCLRALTRIDQWQPGTRLDSWMYRIAQNLWLDRMRANKVRGQSVNIDDVHDLTGTDGRAVTEGRLTLEVVEKAIRRLPEEQQVLIALVCVEGLAYKDAADVLGVPIGTVMSRLARARKALHEMTNEPSTSAAQKQVELSRGRTVR